MSIHTLKQIVNLVPEASGHIKKAHLNEEFPVDSRDAAISSALQVNYLTKVANQIVPLEVLEKVAKAVRLYGVKSEVDGMTNTMVKQAYYQNLQADTEESQVKEAERIIESQMQGFFNMEKVASAAEALYDSYADSVQSDAVKLYAGAGMLNKEAAIAALRYRSMQTGNKEFEKVAHVIQGINPETLGVEENRTIARSIAQLEKKAGLFGRDIYKEIFLVKQAAMASATSINLGGMTTTAAKVYALDSATVADILGHDIAEMWKLPPNQLKPAMEALPIGEKQALARLLR